MGKLPTNGFVRPHNSLQEKSEASCVTITVIIGFPTDSGATQVRGRCEVIASPDDVLYAEWMYRWIPFGSCDGISEDCSRIRETKLSCSDAPKVNYFFDDLPKGPSANILRLKLPALIDRAPRQITKKEKE